MFAKKMICAALCLISWGVAIKDGHAFDWEDIWETLGRESNFHIDVEIHGFASQGFLHSKKNNFYTADTKKGSFEFNEFGLNVMTNFSERLRLGVQWVSRDLGKLSNNTIHLDWAYVDYRWKDWLGIRAGRFKIPYGFYNETRDFDMLRSSIFLPPSIYYEGDRDILSRLDGVSLYGDISLHSWGDASYQFQYGGVSIDTDGTTIQYLENADFVIQEILDYELEDMYVAELKWEPPLDGVKLGSVLILFDESIDFLTTENEFLHTFDIPLGAELHEENNNLTRNTFSIEYSYGDVLIAAEYMRDSEDREGYYAAVTYQLADWWDVGMYYSVFFPDRQDKKGTRFAEMNHPDYLAWQKECVVTTRFNLDEDLILKIEGHFVDGAAMILLPNQIPDVEKHSFLLAVKATYNF